MPAAVLVRGGPVLYVVELAPRRYVGYPVAPSLEEAALRAAGEYADGLPVDLVRALRAAGGEPVGCSDPALRRVVASAGLPVRAPTLEEERAAVAALPAQAPLEERAFLLRLARDRVQTTLLSDEEALIALAREEERLERVVNRERGAADQFLAARSGPLAEYSEEWTSTRAAWTEHHDRLYHRLELLAEATVPNLTRLLGARVAARLVALAGGRAALGRVSASRLQVLGSRRRPGGGRGPRFGVLYRGARMGDVPRDRQGRYARSLAALAVIAARADAITHRDLGEVLIVRRDRRINRLRQRS